MKKTNHVNIGGMVFTIDEDACHRLAGYLEVVEAHFRDSGERQEIVGDIESRIAELLRKRMGSREVVVMEDIVEIIGILGDPEEFGGSGGSSGGPGKRAMTSITEGCTVTRIIVF